MTDFFDGFVDSGDIDPMFADVDGNMIPDRHESNFIRTTDSPVPDVVNGAIDQDGDGVPDHVDGHIDRDGFGLDYRTWLDSGGDGMNDWVDPFSTVIGAGLSSEIRHILAIEHVNPFYR